MDLIIVLNFLRFGPSLLIIYLLGDRSQAPCNALNKSWKCFF